MSAAGPSLRKIEKNLATEMATIIDRLGPDHPGLVAALGRYVAELPRRHPDWMPVMRGAHERLISRRSIGRPRPRHAPR